MDELDKKLAHAAISETDEETKNTHRSLLGRIEEFQNWIGTAFFGSSPKSIQTQTLQIQNLQKELAVLLDKQRVLLSNNDIGHIQEQHEPEFMNGSHTPRAINK